MKAIIITLAIMAIATCCSVAQAYVMTFDDVPAGGDITYYSNLYGASFYPGFVIADHSQSVWGPPHSGTEVLTWNADSSRTAQLSFGYSTPSNVGTIPHYSIQSISAYFGTDYGVMVQMTGYHGSLANPVVSITIGDPYGSWSNQYAELTSEAGDIDFIIFEGIGSADARLGFCADDITIIPVPEPTTLVGLLAPFGAMLFWRRR